METQRDYTPAERAQWAAYYAQQEKERLRVEAAQEVQALLQKAQQAELVAQAKAAAADAAEWEEDMDYDPAQTDVTQKLNKQYIEDTELVHDTFADAMMYQTFVTFVTLC